MMQQVLVQKQASLVVASRAAYPVLVVTTSGAPMDEGMRATNAWIAEQLEVAAWQDEKVAVVLDVSGRTGRPTPAQRSAIGDWMTEHERLIASTCVAWSMVMTSPVLRGVLTAITWFHAFPCPMKIQPSVQSSLRWSLPFLEKTGFAAQPNEVERMLSALNTEGSVIYKRSAQPHRN